MKFKTVLKEEYYDTHKAPQYMKSLGSYDVFKNPSPSEYKEVSDDASGEETVRFIAANKGKQLYIFNQSIIHPVVMRNIYPGKNLYDSNFLIGEAAKMPEGWECTSITTKDKKSSIKKKWNWVSKYMIFDKFWINSVPE